MILEKKLIHIFSVWKEARAFSIINDLLISYSNLKCTIIAQCMQKFFTSIFSNQLGHCIWIWIKNLYPAAKMHKVRLCDNKLPSNYDNILRISNLLLRLKRENSNCVDNRNMTCKLWQYLWYAPNNSLKFYMIIFAISQQIRLVKLYPIQQRFLFIIIYWFTIVVQSIQVQIYPRDLYCSWIYIKPIYL